MTLTVLEQFFASFLLHEPRKSCVTLEVATTTEFSEMLYLN